MADNVEELGKGAEKLAKALKGASDKAKDLFKEMEKGGDAKNLEKANEITKKLSKNFEKASDSFEELTKSMDSKDPEVKMKALNKLTESFGDGFDKQSKKIKGTISSLYLHIERKATVTMDRVYSKQARALKNSAKEFTKLGEHGKAKQANESLNDLTVKHSILRKDLGKRTESSQDYEKQLRTTSVPFLGKGTPASQLYTGAKEAKENVKNPEKLTALADTLKVLSKDAGGAAGMFTSLASGLEMVAKVGGPILGIISMFVTLGKVINDLDKFLKELNNNAASMAGAISGVNDPGKFFKKFNDALFDTQKKLELGLDAKDISNYYRTLDAFGMSLQGVSKEFGDYDKAIDLGKRASIEFGVDLDTMGNYIGELSKEMRFTSDDIAKSFSRMSMDAGKAGISSQKFFQMVEASTSSLSYYGKFVDAASNSIRKLSDSSLMGQKDIQELATTLLGAFQNMTDAQKGLMITQQRAQFIAEAQQHKDEEQAKLEGYRKEYAGAKTDDERTNILQGKIRPQEGELRKWTDALEASKSDSPLDLIPYLPKFSADFPKHLLKAVEDTNFRLGQKNKFALMRVLQAQIPIGDKQLLQLIDIKEQAEDQAKKFGKYVSDNYDGIINNLDDITNAVDEVQKGDASGNQDLIDALTKAGLKPEDISEFKDLLKNDPELKDMLEALKKGGSKEDFLRGLDKAVARFGEYKLENLNKPKDETKDLMSPEEKKKQDAVIKSMTPLEKIWGIEKEGVKYMFADSELQRHIAGGVYEVAGWASKIFWHLVKKSPESAKQEYVFGKQSIAEHKDQSDKLQGTAKDMSEVAADIRTLISDNGDVTDKQISVMKSMGIDSKMLDNYRKTGIISDEDKKTLEGQAKSYESQSEKASTMAASLLDSNEKQEKYLSDLVEQMPEIADAAIPDYRETKPWRPGDALPPGVYSPPPLNPGQKFSGIPGIPPADAIAPTAVPLTSKAGLKGVAQVSSDTAPTLLHKGEYITDQSVGNFLKDMDFKSLASSLGTKDPVAPADQNFTFNMNVQSNNPKEFVDYLERYVKQALRSQAVVPA